jgi:hypothetical protein
MSEPRLEALLSPGGRSVQEPSPAGKQSTPSHNIPGEEHVQTDRTARCERAPRWWPRAPLHDEQIPSGHRRSVRSGIGGGFW